LSATGPVNEQTVSVLKGLTNSDNVIGGITNTTPAGIFTTTVNGQLTNFNYTITQRISGTWTITRRPATITYTANPLSSICGNAISGLTGTASATGLVSGNTLAGVTTGTAAFSTTAGATSNVGSYVVTGSGLNGNSANYTFSFAQAPGNATALTITPRPITITANSLSRLYGAANPALTFAVDGSGLANGNTLSSALATTATTASNMGNYAINQGTLPAGSNML
jgi:MBG domain (YGX type)